MANVIEFRFDGKDNFSKASGRINKSLATLVKTTVKVGTVLATATTATALFVKKFTEGEDRVAKFSKRLGEAVEVISAIEFAGERSGLAVGTVDMAMQRLQRRAEEAAEGMGEARQAFRDMGIEADAFTRLPMDDKLAAIAEGLNNVENRTKTAFKLFDSEGVAMLQMLGEGEESFRALTDEAERFGRVVSAQAAANAERFQDSWTNMTSAIGGVFKGISDELAPLMTGLMDRLANFFANSREGIITFTNNFIRSLFTISAIFHNVFNSIGEFLTNFFTAEGFTANLKIMRDSFVNSFKFIFNYLIEVWPKIGVFLFDTFKVAFDGIVEIGRWAWENIKSIFTDQEGPSLADLLFERMGKATSDARATLEESTGELTKTVGAAWEEVTLNIAEAFNITTDTINDQVDQMMEKYMVFGEVVESTNKSILSSTTGMMEQFSGLWSDYMRARGDETKFLSESLFKTATGAIDAISAAVGAAIVQGKNLMESFRNIAKLVLTEVIAIFVKMGVQRLVTSALTLSATKAEAMASAGAAIGATFANTMASMSMAPFPINLTAPAVAAGHAAAAASGYTAGAATGAGLGAAAIAHGGMTNVPSESTYFLDQGERVLSPRQNVDLIEFLKSQKTNEGTGGGLTIENLQIDVLPNATNAEALLNMDPVEMKEVVVDKIIEALDELTREGIRPLYAG